MAIELIKIGLKKKSVIVSTKTKKIIEKFINLAVRCWPFLTLLDKAEEFKTNACELTATIEALSFDEKSELLDLMYYGQADLDWENLVIVTRKQIDDSVAEKLVSEESLAKSLKQGYQKLLMKCN